MARGAIRAYLVDCYYRDDGGPDGYRVETFHLKGIDDASVIEEAKRFAPLRASTSGSPSDRPHHFKVRVSGKKRNTDVIIYSSHEG